jgi:hypothetical protein
LPDQPVDNTIGKDKKSIINVGSKTWSIETTYKIEAC